jgi:outer membrane protein assembly factor BamB
MDALTARRSDMERRRTVSLALLAVLSVLLAACDWSQVGFDASHTGYNPGEPSLTPSSVKHLTPAWTFSDSGSTNLLVANGTVYANERGDLDVPDEARAFNATDGTLRWKTSTPPGSSLVAVGNGLVYYQGGDHTVHARDAATGSARWSVPGNPLVLDGTRMFAATAATVIALAPSGTTQWSTPSVGEVVSAVGQSGHLVVASFVATSNAPGGFVVISTYDETDGTVLGRIGVVPKNADGTVDPPLGFSAGPRLFYLTGTSNLFAVDPATGAVAWHVSAGRAGVLLTPRSLVVGQTSPITGAQSSLTALDPRTGATQWTAPFSGTIDGLAVAGDVVFVGHTGFNPLLGMLVYDLRTGEQVASSTEVCCGPIPSQGHVFVQGARGVEALVPS